jgi:hypothetical protein
MSGLWDDAIEVLMATEVLAEPGVRNEIQSRVTPRLDGARRAKYRALHAANFADAERQKRVEETLVDIDALPVLEVRKGVLIWIRDVIPGKCLEQWAERVRSISDHAQTASLVAPVLRHFPDETRPQWRDWVISRTCNHLDDSEAARAFGAACEFLPAEEGEAATATLFAQVLRMAAAARNFFEQSTPADVIAALGWSLTSKRQAQMLEALENCIDSAHPASCLTAVARRIDASNLERALALTRADNGVQSPGVLFALAGSLEGQSRVKVRREGLALVTESRERYVFNMGGLTATDISPLTDETVTMTRARSHPHDRPSWLPVLAHAPSFSMKQRFEIWEILVSVLARESRQFSLANTLEKAPLIDAIGGAEARHACAEAILTATAWWP